MTTSRRRAFVLCLWAVAAGARADEKLTVEQIFSRHVDSIGTAEARAAAAGRVAKGPINYIRKPATGGSGENEAFAGRPTSITVPAVLATGGPRYLLDLRYGWKDHPFDRVVYDGARVKNARQLTPGNYSVIVGLLMDNQYLLKAGLLAGPLTTAWAPLHSTERFEKLEYAGRKKAGSTPAHRVDARLKSDPEHEISFFFDAENFRLVKTLIWVGPNARRKIEEDFSDYKTVEGLTLPHTWDLKLDAPVDRWVFKLEELRVATELPEEAFVTE